MPALTLPPTARPIDAGHLALGGQDPHGNRIGVTNAYLTWNGRPRVLASGEFHFARCPAGAWATELHKIKAGGINLVATYVFWIHHEATPGVFDWSGDRALRQFVQLCAAADLPVLVRIGPFAHGECRNGGLPDWLYGQPFAVRSNDERYLRLVERYYGALGEQLHGLLFKDGGPVIGIQLENEYMHTGAPWEVLPPPAAVEWVPAGQDGADHLRRLKRLAQAAGLSVPIYTATAWGGAPIIDDESLPVYGDYAYPVWIDDPSPSSAYLFADRHALPVAEPTHRVPYHYPLAMAELQGGIQVRYANRPVVPPRSTEAMALVCLGNGSNWIGYYMYHGGTNPLGPYGFSNERLHPLLSYDFQAPLSEYGEVRTSYRYLKLLHLFVDAYGELLAPMQTVLPDDAPLIRPDTVDVVRWCVRTRHGAGFLFVNNFQDHVAMRSHSDVRFAVDGPEGVIQVPEQGGMTIAPELCCILPLGLDLHGSRLRYATAQPLTILPARGVAHYFFFAVPGNLPEYCFEAGTLANLAGEFEQAEPAGDRILIRVVPGVERSFSFTAADGASIRITTLTREEAEHTWRGAAWGAERVIVCTANLIFADDAVHLRLVGDPATALTVFPAVASALVTEGGELAVGTENGCTQITVNAPAQTPALAIEACGDGKYQISAAGNTWQGISDLFLHIDYTGDTAMAFVDGKLVADNFGNGLPWRIGLERFLPDVLAHGVCLVFRPLRQGIVRNISSSVAARFHFEGEEQLAVHALEAIPVYLVKIATPMPTIHDSVRPQSPAQPGQKPVPVVRRSE